MDVIISEHIESLLKRLEKESILRQLPRSFSSPVNPPLIDTDISKLMSYASIMSLSENTSDFSLAYEIVSRIIEYTEGKSKGVIAGSEVILSRIGNFPGRKLLQNRYNQNGMHKPSLNLQLECIAREAENTVYLSDEKELPLTDFQYKLLEHLENESSLSVSAPTSAGKSFILNIDLIRKLKSHSGQSIVYIVPTRALVTEVSKRIRNTLSAEQFDNILVRTAPFPIEKEKLEHSVVYVLTQERLMSLINSKDGQPFVTSLIVDEAHEIQKGKRGIVLQSAIDCTLAKFPKSTILFASPLIKNPLYFLSLFKRENSGRYFVESVSPVSQNIIFISEIAKKVKSMEISVFKENETISIGTVESGFRFRGSLAIQKANLALSLAESSESVIIFSNIPSDAEKSAEKVAQYQKKYEPTPKVLAFIKFIELELHQEHLLIKCLNNGVAFHYGSMPSLIRLGVEELFRDEEIKILCCTSTLLQGVNLPAKHIIIDNPKSGDDPMTRADFLNLAGRAGRLLCEFHGNIWCIRPDHWSSDCYKGERLQSITSAVSDVMADGGTILQEMFNGTLSSAKEVEKAEAAFGKLHYDFVISNDEHAIELHRRDDNSESLNATVEIINSIKTKLPKEILQAHQGLRPDHLQALYNSLYSEDNLEIFIPLNPRKTGAKHRLDYIYGRIIESFGLNAHERFKNLICGLAHNWAWGEKMSSMLQDQVKYRLEVSPTRSVTSIIREYLGTLENEIRYKLVKYISAYIDILAFVLKEKGMDELSETIEPYHIYLEFGSCNKHSLNLMALGLSRFSALHLEKQFSNIQEFNTDATPEMYIDRIKKMKLPLLNLPEVCRKEVMELFGIVDL